MNQTIVAPATASGRAAVGIIRISGPRAKASLLRLAPELRALEPRRAYVAIFRDRVNAPIDRGLALFFSGPASATGEDLAELHAHGGVGVMTRLQRELLTDEALRLAEPGEFTRRAILNGKLDWLQAEALAELLSAETEQVASAAARQLTGEYGEWVRGVQRKLAEAATEIEGMLAFPSEAEIQEVALLERVGTLQLDLAELLARVERGALLRRTPRVVLSGPVNAGKSTLFNRIVGSDRAIVDAEPGTTRDSIEARVHWKDQAMVWVDTAGFRSGPGRVERLGIDRTCAEVRAADVWIWLLPPGDVDGSTLPELVNDAGTSPIVVRSKADLLSGGDGLPVSGQTGVGVSALLDEVAARVAQRGSAAGALFVHDWHRIALSRVKSQLEAAHAAASARAWDAAGMALVAASDEMTSLLQEPPREVSEDIFRRFCIGK